MSELDPTSAIDETGDVGARVAQHLRAAFELLGLTADVDPELDGTPERVAQLAAELTSGLGPPPALTRLAYAGAGQGLVTVRDIHFHSLCAHHLLPFFGRAHIGYAPRDAIVGIGAPARVLEHFARRPQLQERLGRDVAEYLARETEARGAIVVIEARQLCMEMRGERAYGVVESTAAVGDLVSGDLRREFFARLGANEKGDASDDR